MKSNFTVEMLTFLLFSFSKAQTCWENVTLHITPNNAPVVQDTTCLMETCPDAWIRKENYAVRTFIPFLTEPRKYFGLSTPQHVTEFWWTISRRLNKATWKDAWNKLKGNYTFLPSANAIKEGTIKNIHTLDIPSSRSSNGSYIAPFRVVSTLNLLFSNSTLTNYVFTARTQDGDHPIKKLVVETASYTWITVTAFLILLLILGLCSKKIFQQRKRIEFLSRNEVEEFHNGHPEALADIWTADDHINDKHHLLPYNSDYEIPKENLTLDRTQILGEGTYGMVIKGKLKCGNLEEIDVAVKTVKPKEPRSNFKVLLCEVKIMAYIGTHPNIVSLMGAYTRNIGNRELLVAMEYCGNGNLQDFLRLSRTDFQDLYSTSVKDAQATPVVPGYSNPVLKVSTLDLLKWSGEIATGMDFLRNKRVIHGDLACRNVLLTTEKVAKVGDFGLSKHIFHYTSYKKHGVQLLPWRWMAPESLRDLTFSLHTDAWAFGVTLWEIFTLAETPYPGMVWNYQFIEILKNGYRLPRPEFANGYIYERLILPCWNQEPSERPRFSDLRLHFNKLFVALSLRQKNEPLPLHC